MLHTNLLTGIKWQENRLFSLGAHTWLSHYVPQKCGSDIFQSLKFVLGFLKKKKSTLDNSDENIF